MQEKHVKIGFEEILVLPSEKSQQNQFGQSNASPLMKFHDITMIIQIKELKILLRNNPAFQM